MPPLTGMVPVYGVFTVPDGGVPSVSVAGAVLTVTGTVPVPVFCGLLLSVAFTVTVLVPVPVGVPVMVQFAPRARPAGSVPAVIVQVYGPVPPLTGIVPVYGVFTVAVGGVPSVSVVVPGLMVVVMVPEPVLTGLLLSVTETVPVVVPGVVGVPVIWQLLPSVSPAGRLPELSVQVYGPVPPLTGTAPVYGVPAVPLGGDATVSVAGADAIVMLTGRVVVFAGLEESVARTVGMLVPATVGVPVTLQFAPNARPAGNDPETTVQVYGPVPPLTGSVDA